MASSAWLKIFRGNVCWGGWTTCMAGRRGPEGAQPQLIMLVWDTAKQHAGWVCQLTARGHGMTLTINCQGGGEPRQREGIDEGIES